MSWWSKLWKPAERVAPSWSTFERVAHFDAFVALVVEALMKHGVETETSKLVSEPLAEGLRAVLVRDILGAMELTVRRAEVRGWRLEEADLVRMGIANAVAADLGKLVTQSLETPIGRFELVVSNGFYLGACMLATLEKVDWPLGGLVAFISWHHVVIHEILESSSRATLVEMRRIVNEVADSIAVGQSKWLGTRLYWHHGGRSFETIEVEGDAIGAGLPAGLAALLDRDG